MVSLECHGNTCGQLRVIRITGVSGWNRGCSIKVVSVGLTEKVTLEQRLKVGEGVSSVETWGRNFLGRGQGQGKGPEAGEQEGPWGRSRERVSSRRRRQKGDGEPGEADHCFGFSSEWDRELLKSQDQTCR